MTRSAANNTKTRDKTDRNRRSARPKRHRDGFLERECPPDLQRGLFTVFLDDGDTLYIGQVWASTPSSAASMMAPWAKGRLRRAEYREEVPVELVGWGGDETSDDVSEATGIPEDELDPGCEFGIELIHAWVAHEHPDGQGSTIYVVETIAWDQGLEPDW